MTAPDHAAKPFIKHLARAGVSIHEFSAGSPSAAGRGCRSPIEIPRRGLGRGRGTLSRVINPVPHFLRDSYVPFLIFL